MTEESPFKEEYYIIIGCAMEVHKTLGPRFLDLLYQKTLSWGFCESAIPFQKEIVLDVWYKETILNKKYVTDFICYDEVILETKAMEGLTPDHIAQVLNYLKATD